ncbi:MAG: hypothetical protein LKE39_04635 [Sphaerochaeta sp.]|jgi:hypothetical protein|nr:hypothetical protein [Sphaerochaeta sp.]MCH3919754.1 hypothetical protein [Sphaerochaeta sp.]MCI2045519.1 hypothetical protein [Sphaerochaeta sp.]MCI2076239.1 hypothetical protein [Sphaerochaeta sp.]MCI2104718.1 hypothetical protein [Sphaerochaeta sp.]
MKKLEIIISQAVDGDFLHDLEVLKVGEHYTRTTGVQGKGYSFPKMGDDVWPQLNNHYMIVASDEEVEGIRKILNHLRGQYPGEGIACFVSEAEEL